jgi:adenine-specific DNA-methyltransferase
MAMAGSTEPMAKKDRVAGKTNRRASRLSEGAKPRPLDYALTYPGKQHEGDILTGCRAMPEKRLSVTKVEDARWRNRLYSGENLGVLRALLDDPTVRRKVRLVYIDPPFATGGVFESRNGGHAYEDLAYGAHYLEFLRQRLIVLRELIDPRGSIYLHLDETMAFAVKVIMDEVFGPMNYRNWITRKKSNRKNFTRKQYGNISDYILFYTRTDDYVWNRPYESWTDEWAAREYQYIEEGTGRRYKKVPVHAPGVRNGETGQPWRGKMPPPGKHWQFPPRVLDELDARGEIYWSPNKNPRRKLYFDQSEGVPVQDIWLDCRDAHNQMIEVTGYPTEKPLELLRRIVSASSNPGDLVLDCFGGSGTTLVAAEEMGRRWIGVDSGLEAIATTVKRLANGSEPMGDFVRGKKVKEATLFDHPSTLRTSFDLYQAEGPSRITADMLESWSRLFPIDTASILR